MLKCNLLCIGKLKENYWRAACGEYAKRLQPFCRFSMTELPEYRLPENPSEAQIQSALETEGNKILSVSGHSFMVALCIEGQAITSEQMSQKIHAACVNGISEIVFVIGSSYGLADRVKKHADFQLSMSAMTFPHQLARVMICEQIYRTFQILNHGKYHK